MGRGKKKPLLSVAQVFTKCQEGVSGHDKYSKILWDVQEAEPDNCWKDFCFCLEHLLGLPEVRQAARFLCCDPSPTKACIMFALTASQGRQVMLRHLCNAEMAIPCRATHTWSAQCGL